MVVNDIIDVDADADVDDDVGRDVDWDVDEDVVRDVDGYVDKDVGNDVDGDVDEDVGRDVDGDCDEDSILVVVVVILVDEILCEADDEEKGKHSFWHTYGKRDVQFKSFHDNSGRCSVLIIGRCSIHNPSPLGFTPGPPNHVGS